MAFRADLGATRLTPIPKRRCGLKVPDRKLCRGTGFVDEYWFDILKLIDDFRQVGHSSERTSRQAHGLPPEISAELRCSVQNSIPGRGPEP